jgi:heat shock protein HslJ
VTGSIITVTFNADGTLNGSAVCKNYNGRYTANNGRITISELSLSINFCVTPPGIMEQETAYTNALRAAVTFELPDRTTQMLMRNAAGQVILRYILR